MKASYDDETITRITELARQHQDVAAVWLYGSRAKGTAHKQSDYDIGVLFSVYIGDTFERRLRPELLALDWARQLRLNENMLSVADVQQVPIPLAMNIISGILLYCSDYDARLMAERTIMSKAELDYQYHLTHFGT